jgi:hypothetical protein
MKLYQHLTHGQREKRCWQCAFYKRNQRDKNDKELACGGGIKDCPNFKKYEVRKCI